MVCLGKSLTSISSDLNKIRILHSFPPQYKVFVKFCKLTFSMPNLENTFVNTLSDEPKELNENFDIVIVHFLRDSDCEFLIKNEITIPTILFSWGADIFQLGKFYNRFLMPKTKRLRTKHYFRNNFYIIFKKILHTAFPFLLDFRKKNKTRLKALQKLDYITPVIPQDYKLLEDSYGKLKAKLYHLNYVNPVLNDENPSLIETGENILLGNSSSYTNNHIEAIDHLSTIDLKGRKIVIPLSYGDKPVADFIADYSQKKLGVERVNILTEILPASDYSKIIDSCGIVIMNHLRQQAMGNIMEALFKGCHLYLQSNSPVFEFLTNNGFIISSFEDKTSLRVLTFEEKKKNQLSCLSFFGINRQHQRLNTLFNKIITS